MDVTSSNLICNTQTDHSPLLMMERVEMHRHDHEHIIDMARNNNDASSPSSSHDHDDDDDLHPELDGGPSSAGTATHQTSSSTLTSRLNSRNSASFSRRGDSYGRRRRSPLNSGLWISVELLVTVCQIVASVVVLLLSRNEHPKAPLFAWVVGYASGCVATLPILYWRFRTRNEGVLQDSRDGALQTGLPDSAPYTAISINQEMETPTRADHQPSGNLNERISGVMDHLKMGLDCFFAVWFVVGNVWIFGGHASPDDAPKLYKLCIVFLTFSCIGYAMPFILCATICCCLPCIISLLGFREEFNQTRGASPECINSLPTYKFKSKENGSSFRDNDHDDSSEMSDGGILAAGTEKERMISGEDAVCCICLNEYEDDEELRELPCAHVFHVECVDKWLKINASCPLCKSEICEIGEDGSPPSPTSQH
ncbi:E3 ubiquitin-protein ligase At4g11680 [Linum grandiflorum]